MLTKFTYIWISNHVCSPQLTTREHESLWDKDGGAGELSRHTLHWPHHRSALSPELYDCFSQVVQLKPERSLDRCWLSWEKAWGPLGNAVENLHLEPVPKTIP